MRRDSLDPTVIVRTWTILSAFLPAIFAQSSGLVVFGRSSCSLNSSRMARRRSSPLMPRSPVAGADHDDVAQPLDAVDLREELGHDGGLNIGRDSAAAGSEEGVHLVEEHDHRIPVIRLFLRLLEDLPDLAFRLAHVLVEELGPLDVQEKAPNVLARQMTQLLGDGVGHGFRDQGLAAAWRAV